MTSNRQIMRKDPAIKITVNHAGAPPVLSIHVTTDFNRRSLSENLLVSNHRPRLSPALSPAAARPIPRRGYRWQSHVYSLRIWGYPLAPIRLPRIRESPQFRHNHLY